MTDERFKELLAGYLGGQATEADLAELHQAVFASPSRRKCLQEETRLHVLLREALAEEVELQALQPVAPARRRAPERRRCLPLAAGMAAAVLLAAGVLTGLWYWSDGKQERQGLGVCLDVSTSGDVTIERGGRTVQAVADLVLDVGDRVVCDTHARAMLRLADGSNLSMEPGSSVVLVSDRPQVRLERGEVLFEIAQRPADAPAFEVRTGQSTVAVMGTVFTVETGDHTRVKVYEGRVALTRHSDSASVEVGSLQTATTAAKELAAVALFVPAPQPTSTVRLLPTDDATLDRGARALGALLKVEGDRRTAYLRFVVPAVGRIHSARLRLTQAIDPGQGTLRFWLADHSKWAEDTLTSDTAPDPVREVARRTGVVRRNQIIEVDVSDAIQKPGPVTIVITLNKKKEHDIWFGSKESDTPPELILEHSPQVRSP